MIRNLCALFICFGLGWLANEFSHALERRRHEKSKVWHNGRPCRDRNFHNRRDSDPNIKII